MISASDVDKVVDLYYNENTRAAYHSDLADFIGAEPEQIQSIILKWKDYSTSTIQRRKAPLSKLLKLLAQEGRVEHGFFDNLVFPTGRPAGERVAVNLDQIRIISSRAETTQQKLLLAVLVDTGLRLGTVAKLRVDDLTTEEFVIRTKRSRDIKVYTTPTIRELAQTLRSEMPDATYAFGETGNTQTRYKRVYRMFKRMAGSINAHDIRHYVATRLVKNNVPITTIAHVLGHKSISTTQRYVHTDGKEVQKAVLASSVSEGVV